LYADDILLADESRDGLQTQLRRWDVRLKVYGMSLNAAKSVYVEYGEQTEGTISVNRSSLKKALQTRYLGSIFSSDGGTGSDARARVRKAWAAWRLVLSGTSCLLLPPALKVAIYVAFVRPVALYGCECWPAEDRLLRGMEKQMLRESLGLPRHGPMPDVMIRERLGGAAPIAEKMREARLRWYSRLARSSEGSVARTALLLSYRGGGRPKKRWLDRVSEDIRAANAAGGLSA
jgi:hypothetical protein